MASAPLLSDRDRQTLHRLRRVLDAHGYASTAEAAGAVDLRTIPALAHKFGDATQASLLIRLFLLGLKATTEAIETVLTRDDHHALVGLGMLEQTDDAQWRSGFKLFAYRDAIVCCDHQRQRDAPIEPVYTPGSDSINLIDAGVRHPFARALDLCTGSGIQAVMSGRHAGTVVAVDINPRAARCAAMSLALNRATGEDVRRGDLYEAVNEDTFDFITANPPFVINQVRTQLYRDGGPDGGDILRRILEGLPAHLAPSGYAQIVTLLHDFEDHSQLEEVRTFSAQHHLETLVLTSPPIDRYELATSQLQAQVHNYPRYQTAVHEYLEHLTAVKLISCQSAVITCRKSGRFAFEVRPALRRVATFKSDLTSHLKRFYGWT